MLVLSVNINKCGGICSNGKGEIYDAAIADRMKNMIIDFLEIDENNVVFINELNDVKDNRKSFEELFAEKIYTIHKPSHFEDFCKKQHPYGCTVAITKSKSVWEQSLSIDIYDQKSGVLSYANKSVILKNGDIILAGMHIPYDTDYWDEIIKYFRENREKRLYMVGDFNVFEEGTDRCQKFNELKKEGAIDVWLNCGGDHGHITYKNGRVDYLLSSVIGYSSIRKMSYLDSLRLNGLTDHSGVLFEILK